MSDAAALFDALLEAQTAPGVLTALARSTWHNAHDGAPCPAEAIPTPAALAEWLHDCPEAAFVEATARLNAMTAGAAEWVWTVNRPLPGLSAPDMTPEVIAHDGYYIASVVNLHARWLDMPAADDRPLHPLAPLVQAWQRGRCVLDAKPRVLFGADLTSDRLDAEDEAAMLELATTAEPDGPDTAPMLDFGVRDPAGLVPPYLLDAYRAGGGASVSRGRGGPAPVRQRLWLHGLTAIEPTDRTGDMRRFGPLAIGKHLIDPLWPYGWDYQRSDWPSLLNAIRAVNGQPLLYQGPGGILKEVHLIAFTDYPVTAPNPRALRAATFRGRSRCRRAWRGGRLFRERRWNMPVRSPDRRNGSLSRGRSTEGGISHVRHPRSGASPHRPSQGRAGTNRGDTSTRTGP